MIYKVESEHLTKIKVDVKSSLIEYLDYSQQTYILSVKFKHGKYKGKVKHYEEILPFQFFELLQAPSVGKALLKLLDSLKENREYT